MTRINLIHPSELYDQHLMPEYREIQHVPMALQRSLNKKTGFDKNEIPKQFTLNTGHVKFFYDKGLCLAKRFELIKQELKLRQFSVQEKQFQISLFPEGFQNDWLPSSDDIAIVVTRINEKLNMRAGWYRKTNY
jgi:deoxyribonuclease (pyrimidine dimer)